MSFQPSAASTCPCMNCSGRFGVSRFEFEYGAVDPASLATGTSQNGWPASKNPGDINIVTVAVPLKGGRMKTVRVAAQAAAPMLEMITWWDANIEPVETLGGYNYRDIRGSTSTLSNHASGTAVDINGEKHGPLGTRGTVSASDAVKIAAKAASLGMIWGGVWVHRPDEMHVELAKGGKVATITAAASTTLLPLFLLGGAALWYARRQRWIG